MSSDYISHKGQSDFSGMPPKAKGSYGFYSLIEEWRKKVNR